MNSVNIIFLFEEECQTMVIHSFSPSMLIEQFSAYYIIINNGNKKLLNSKREYYIHIIILLII